MISIVFILFSGPFSDALLGHSKNVLIELNVPVIRLELRNTP